MWGTNSCCTISLPAKMVLKKLKICSSCSMLLWVVVLSLQQPVLCQDVGDYYEYNSSLLPLITQVVNSGISTLTSAHSRDISKRAGFCVTNPDADWNQAFNFSSNPDFFAACIKKTKGDAMLRLCTAAEVKFYFDSLLQQSTRANYLNPNKNCNLTSWPSGCEPGWSCRVGNGQHVDLRDSKDIPERKKSCQPCCEGFFCPHGITCMIPCPLGSFCPLATLNNKTGVCEPYNYQVPPGQPNHTCGAANIWADVGSSSDIFCPAGSYCPTTIQKRSCSRGHYCRMGSNSQRRCFKVTSCHANATHENIRVYGVILIVALSALLLSMYNCYDQVLTAREKRLAKSREAAVRRARESAKALQRWKDSVKARFPRTFSSRKSITHPQQLGNLNQPKSDIDEHLDSPTESSISRTPSPSSTTFEGKRKEPRHVKQTLCEIDEDPDDYEGVSLETADLNAKGHVPKGRNLSTSQQIYMATSTYIKRRPLIKISFNNLSLTLKAKNKRLLRCVTGEIKPGHITAIMGTSGAGKTTLLCALAGRAIGCNMTGSILINGKSESIHSYKKVVGFVPQDDIVHGNLTVEENLQFSADCRLSADLPKLDKVIKVDRVIESLGLRTVRNSLVGTVEKRGISGGQRKRVNIGLELVMEPSLLILDEPTSGLDSSCSQLLLEALGREALEGANICMVVHQPSYSLFRMFDDLVLLAKGGLVVYHGPVNNVEEYFSRLEINVPQRVNPPDHYIDVLERNQPSASSGVNYEEELPVRWMLHKGYLVPTDMQEIAAKLGTPPGGMHSSHAASSAGSGMEDRSLSGEKLTRKTPAAFRQYKYFFGRIGKQRMRETKLLATDYLILLLAGVCLGALATFNDQTFGAAGFTYTIIAVSLLCKIAALRSFSLEKLQYRRESASGMSSLAYFLAKDTIDHLNTVIKPVVYLSMFYFFTNPRSTFLDNYVVLLCLVYCVTGIAYALAIFLEPGPAQLCSVLLPVVLTLISARTSNSGAMKHIAYLCYPRWALEALVIANAERYYGVWLITRCGLLLKSGYNLHHWGLCLSILFGIGVFSRTVAFFGMVTCQRK